jgi:signal transduction histidine kinase
VLQSSGSDAMTLLNSTLSLSALEAGRATVNSKEFAVRDLVEHALSPAKLAAAAKPDLRVELTVDDRTPPRVIGDPDRLLQVLMNLTGNAVKFTERGVVSLTAYPAHVADRVATLAFVVSDTGIGIPADRLPHIFDEFTQASPEIGRRYGGTGLGLAISRKLLRLLGSDLRVSSTVGEGTTFSFEVECTLADAAE